MCEIKIQLGKHDVKFIFSISFIKMQNIFIWVKNGLSGLFTDLKHCSKVDRDTFAGFTLLRSFSIFQYNFALSTYKFICFFFFIVTISAFPN